VDGLDQAGAGPATPIGGVSGWRGLKSVKAQIAPEGQDPPRPGGGPLCPV
jgi:hypothetical protein